MNNLIKEETIVYVYGCLHVSNSKQPGRVIACQDPNMSQDSAARDRGRLWLPALSATCPCNIARQKAKGKCNTEDRGKGSPCTNRPMSQTHMYRLVFQTHMYR